MKQRLYIALMGLATMLMVVLAYVPHHHHEGAVCMTTEHCDTDNRDNDRHTQHSNHGGESCMESANFILSKVSTNYHLYHSATLFSAIIIHVLSCTEVDDEDENVVENPYINHYHSVDYSGGNSLRAPPRV